MTNCQPLKDFILPGGTPAGAACHMARAICRRAERRVCTLAASETVNPASLRYINRLSDLLFVLARTINTRVAATVRYSGTASAADYSAASGGQRLTDLPAAVHKARR